MIKQLTALILILAIANPYCCCFGMGSSENGSDSNPMNSCCSQPVDSSDEGDSPSEKNCPCKTSAIYAESEESKVLNLKVTHDILCAHLSPEAELRVTSEPVNRSYFRLRPPPSRLRLHLIHCVFNT